MNATNRLANRALLFVAGVLLLALGVGALAAAAVATGEAPTWIRRPAATVMDIWGASSTWTWQLAGLGAAPAPVVLAAGGCLLLTVVLVVFLGTRRRGGSRTVLEIDAADGRTVVDRDVAESLLTEPLVRRPDVLSARTAAYRIGGSRAVELAVTVRPGAPLGAVVDAAEAAVREWDELLGERIPIMLHLADRRWRDALRSPRRVQ
ncbi:hypothetical protein AB0E56_16185 [Microbacterium sp. NPDC028030]|uniref:hypothetical protein n=1 Tax=Microbacterium sp. NPDC028030 TaxID=3155124 RepID=UPI00340A1C2A